MECLNSTSLKIEYYELWTDSQTVLKWGSSTKLELRAFERNRVDVIRKRISNKAPRFIPSEQNLADIATRECSTREPEKFKHWTRGPCAFHSPVEGSTIYFPTSKVFTVEQTTFGNRGEAKSMT